MNDVTVECQYCRSCVRAGMAARVNGKQVEGSYSDPLNILKAAKFPAVGVTIVQGLWEAGHRIGCYSFSGSDNRDC